jgi:hypothetical protein
MVINNKEEFEKFYPYDKKYITEYPSEYPCVVKVEFIDGGLAGDYKQVYVAYFPKNIKDSFIYGLSNPWLKIN